MEGQQYIELNPKILPGRPVNSGTRLSAELIVRKLAGGYSFDDILKACLILTKRSLQMPANILRM